MRPSAIARCILIRQGCGINYPEISDTCFRKTAWTKLLQPLANILCFVMMTQRSTYEIWNKKYGSKQQQNHLFKTRIYFESSVNSLSDNSIFPEPIFSMRCLMDLVPGISKIFGERFNNQASAI